MVGEPPAFGVRGQPMRPALHEGVDFRIGGKLDHIERFENGKQREGGRPGRPFERIVVVARAVGMGRAGGKPDGSQDVFADLRVAVIDIARQLVHRPDKRQRQHEFLRHAAGEIHHTVMPVGAVEAAIGGADRRAVEQGEQLGDFGQDKARNAAPDIFKLHGPALVPTGCRRHSCCRSCHCRQNGCAAIRISHLRAVFD